MAGGVSVFVGGICPWQRVDHGVRLTIVFSKYFFNKSIKIRNFGGKAKIYTLQ